MRAAWTVVLVSLLAAASVPAEDRRCGTHPGLRRELRALHDMSAPAVRLSSVLASDADIDEVAVLVDRGDLIVRRNPFDLDNSALRLSRNPGGGYDAARLVLPLEPPGAALGLGDDEARAIDLPFAFPFFAGAYPQAFVHSDGHVTFGAPDAGAGPPGLARFTDGGPRIAAFFADFDPSRGGTISVNAEPARVVILWSGIPGAGQINRNAFQLALHADGTIDIAWAGMQTREGIVGIAPGQSGAATPVDWSDSGRPPAAGGRVERFSESEHVDLVAVTRRFLSDRPDAFQQVVVYTTRPLNPVAGTLAFEINVRNDVQGIGLEVMDHSREWGSAGALESVVYMDSADTYADTDAFEFLAHEVGHRWLARMRESGESASSRSGLLGRGGVHWSFFLDTDASVMEGNAIADRGNGRFETVDVARRFSPLDQYAMGLRLAAEVPAFFYVDVPDDFRPNRPFKASSAPEAGITFTGLRRDVRIEDVVRTMGPRIPAAGPAVFRQAFVLVGDEMAPATDARVRTVARIRSRFGPYFTEATGGRGTASSLLR